MTKSVPAAPQTRKPAAPVRMPQRSEEISGDDRRGEETAIAAVEQARADDAKKPAKKKRH